MEFGLARMVLGSQAFVPIPEAKYLAILEARCGLFECLYVEEKFDLVVGNYLEMEISLLESAAHQMVFRGQDYRWFHVELGLFNRRLANLLSAGRVYVDHVKHHVKRILPPDSKQVHDIDAKFAEQYDARLGYRSMVALRNFVQHRGFPVHSVTFGMRRVPRTGDDGLRYSVSPYLNPAELRKDGGFKKSVLVELEELGEQVDLKRLVRDYVEGLWSVHSEIRGHIQPVTEHWEAVIGEAIGSFRASYPEEETVALAAVKRDSEGFYPESASVFTEFIEYRKTLQGKNHSLVNLVNRYVTSEVVATNA